jgi:hypothetical protein
MKILAGSDSVYMLEGKLTRTHGRFDKSDSDAGINDRSTCPVCTTVLSTRISRRVVEMLSLVNDAVMSVVNYLGACRQLSIDTQYITYFYTLTF